VDRKKTPKTGPLMWVSGVLKNLKIKVGMTRILKLILIGINKTYKFLAKYIY
jgi:hypothetical protein